MSIQQSELILNPDGSVYHLNLKPENIANNIIFVGDQDRVSKITERFDSVEFTTQKREFKKRYSSRFFFNEFSWVRFKWNASLLSNR